MINEIQDPYTTMTEARSRIEPLLITQLATLSKTRDAITAIFKELSAIKNDEEYAEEGKAFDKTEDRLQALKDEVDHLKMVRNNLKRGVENLTKKVDHLSKRNDNLEKVTRIIAPHISQKRNAKTN